MKNVNIERMISTLVSTKRNEVINALMISGIKVYGNITNRDLYDLTLNELKKGNTDLNQHLGDVIDSTFDLSPLNEGLEEFSSTDATKPSWWSENKGNVFSTVLTTGASILGNMFGGKPTGSPTPVMGGGGGGSSSDTLLLQMQMQQQAAQAEADRRRAEEDARRRSNTLIFGVVGGLVVVGVIVAIVLTRPKA